jgi:hypothetical protein
MFELSGVRAASVRDTLDRSPLAPDGQTHVHTLTGRVTPRKEWFPPLESRRNTTN